MCAGSSQRKHKEKGKKMENGPLKETRRAGGAGRACASSSAALALDVLQAGGEEKLAGVADPPPFAWLPAGSYLHTSSALVPARSLQTACGARWSRCHAAPGSGKPFPGSPKSQALQQVLPKPGRLRWGDVGPGGPKRSKPGGGVWLMLIFRSGCASCLVASVPAAPAGAGLD